MTHLIELKTADLTGEALNWSVAKALGMDAFLAKPNYGNTHLVMIRYTPDGCHFEQQKRYRPSTDWAQGGELMLQFGVSLRCIASVNAWEADCWDNSVIPSRLVDREAETPLIAACRAIVASVLGDTVSVPKELV